MNKYVVIKTNRKWITSFQVYGVFFTETQAQEFIDKQTDFVDYAYELKILWKVQG